MCQYADVLLPLALPHALTYRLPDGIGERVSVGSRVLVPVKQKTYAAIVIALHNQRPTGDFEIRDVLDVPDEVPVILPVQLKLWNWIAEYYLCTSGEVYKAALPAGFKRNTKQRRKNTSPTLHADTFECSPLNHAQRKAYQAIENCFSEKNVCLLHGVTSSGKTEIYIHLIAETLRRGKQVLYLLPEIALTTQITDRLRRIFGERMGVYHSKYTDAQRVRLWQRQLSDEPYPLIVGVRSSVFLPFRDLGLVVIDEEHEPSYKQQDPAPRYHARSVALVLASYYGAKVLLGTATPAIETYYNATRGKYGMVTLSERYKNACLPEVIAVDTAELKRKKMMKGYLSPDLLASMREALANGEQVILFQNRRGFAPLIECHTCGWVPKCEHCDVSLTYHKSSRQLVCHYCGNVWALPSACPNCEETDLRPRGFGTEKIEADMRTLFPKATVARMDLDTTRSRTAYDMLISDFAAGHTDILIGTQMISKGLDFEHVSVVGILDADTMLSYPDFRAYERAFQLMAQVAGRAGRREKQGIVWLQTRDTSHPIIDQVRRNDYEGMYTGQLAERLAFGYPPVRRLVYVILKHRYADVVEAAARAVTDGLRSVFQACRVLGPAKPPVGRVQSLHIRQIMVKIEREASMQQARQLLLYVQSSVLQDDRFRSLIVYYDVDPL
ncbi:MAG: primosomal protein N' [Prevotellaceae bacterium]|jgi:primosomal protein N' (replication factor Y)|nr:primosomal protein N' [Prevotellaceae bacterium]